MSLALRVCLAIGIDSVGHVEYYDRVFAKLKIKFPKITRIMFGRMKKRQEYAQNYQALPKHKRKRFLTKFAKMKDGLKKQMADKATGLNYDTGMNLEQDEIKVDGHKQKKSHIV
jgi:hypothetical protein